MIIEMNISRFNRYIDGSDLFFVNKATPSAITSYIHGQAPTLLTGVINL